MIRAIKAFGMVIFVVLINATGITVLCAMVLAIAQLIESKQR